MSIRAGGQRILQRLSGAVVFVSLAATSLFGVCGQPHPRVCTEFYDSDAVFTGTVAAVRTVYTNDLIDGWYYRMKVAKTFRGPSGPFIEVFTENASARFPLEKGRRYLLFARNFDGVLNIGCCGNSGFLGDSDWAIRQIEEIKKTKSGGEIAGRMGWAESPEFRGTRILAIGKAHTYETKVDLNGWFHMKVPEGVYQVRANAPNGGYYPAFDLTYDNPDHIVVQPGGCPQMQFMPN